jgi:hypothetical protein
MLHSLLVLLLLKLLCLSQHALDNTPPPTHTHTPQHPSHPFASPQQVELCEPARADAAGACTCCINVLPCHNGLVQILQTCLLQYGMVLDRKESREFAR